MLGVADAASRGDVVMMLMPDEKHRAIYETEVRDGIAEGNLLLFGHGFSVHYGEVEPPAGVDVALVAPKGPGHLVRRQYTRGLRRAGPDRRPPGCHRQGQGARAGLRAAASAAPAAA